MAGENKVVFESHLPEVKTACAKAMEAGLAALGEYISDQAVRNVTRAKAVDTGQLRNSLSDSSMSVRVLPENKQVVVGTNVEYAIFVEEGTGIYHEGGGGRNTPWRYFYEGKKGKKGWRLTRGQKPVHFLRDAATKNTDAMANVYATAYQSNMPEGSNK